jgi:hypothetical protein
MHPWKCDEWWLARGWWELFEISKQNHMDRTVFVSFFSKSPVSSVIGNG